MPQKRKKPGGFRLPDFIAGSWHGELVGTPSLHFGQTVQPGPPRRAVEFSYLLGAALLLPPDKKFRWPGIVTCWAPTPMKTEFPDAGLMFRSEPSPSLCLSLEVTRSQFSDLVRVLETGRFKEFYFTAEDGAGGHWPIHSWGMTAEIRS